MLYSHNLSGFYRWVYARKWINYLRYIWITTVHLIIRMNGIGFLKLFFEYFNIPPPLNGQTYTIRLVGLLNTLFVGASRRWYSLCTFINPIYRTSLKTSMKPLTLKCMAMNLTYLILWTFIARRRIQ